MYKWSAYPFIRISLVLVLGVVGYEHLPGLWSAYVPVLGILLGVLLLVWGVARYSLLFALVSWILIGYMGGVLAHLHDDRRAPDHYTHLPEARAFVAVVVSDETERTNYFRYTVDLLSAKSDSGAHPVSGSIYLYIRKQPDASVLAPEYGDVLLVGKGYFPVSPPKNPNEFDYRKYLSRENIFAHAFVDPDQVRQMDHLPLNPLFGLAYSIRSEAAQKLDEFISYHRERAILSALLLGVKDHLDNDLKSAYSAAGAMHVLAVSGLHVGIIYFILRLLFDKAKKWKLGRFAIVPVSLAVIWLYAMVTGFSPSVMRAATMFSVMTISDGFEKRSNIYNSLGIAAFLLILYDPFMIYSVGFQLSFVAVFGIVNLHPRLYHLLEFHHKAADYTWSITCVSIAAQLATFPLTLYYFHQFPTYFLVSNLVVIPAATVMLTVGIIMLLVGSAVPLVGKAIGFLFQDFVWLINEAVTSIRYLPYPIYDWLYLDTTSTLLIYGAFIFLILGLSRYSFPSVAVAALLAVALMGQMYWQGYERHGQQKVVFYHLDELVAIDLISGRQATLLVDEESYAVQEALEFQVDPNRLAHGLPPAMATLQPLDGSSLVSTDPIYDLLIWNGKRILILKEFGPYELSKPVSADIVLLLKNLPVPPQMLDTKVLILGPGFKFWELDKAISRYRKHKIQVHSLAQDGFWELDLTTTN